MSTSFSTNIRLFIYGVSDELDIPTVDAHARSLPQVIGSRVSISGLCTIQMVIDTTIEEAEAFLIKRMTFDG